MKKLLLVLLIVFTQVMMAVAQLRLPAIIRDSMILQRDQRINIWGWANPADKVSLRFNKKLYHATADAGGRWTLQLPPTRAGGPYEMQISAGNTITLKEILFGDVWFCSGQSNMVHQLNIHDVTYAREIQEANYPAIRQFWIPTVTSLQGVKENLPNGYWQPAVGDAVRPFSAVAYFFAKKLYQQYKIPIGIINASVGGTPIEAWTSEEGLASFPLLKSTIAKNKDTAYINGLTRRATAPSTRPMPPADEGMKAAQPWYSTSYTPLGWRSIYIPGYWEDQGIKDLNGIVWYRREINIPASMAGKPARVFLGRIVDADELYINGKQVGSTAYQYPQRRYKVPAGLLQEGRNVFVIRVTNTNGKGGFVPDKPYCIFAGADTVELTGRWQYKVGTVFPPFSGFGGGIAAQNQPVALYNAMVAPVINYGIKGFCWYQGESNAGQPKEYAALMPALINDWRSKWANGSLPFLYVQLPGFMEYNYLPSESNWALLREAQLKALAVPNTAMAVAIDLGEWNDIHPDRKQPVGERLALGAQKIAYHEQLLASGPLFDTAMIEGNSVTVHFTSVGAGLSTSDGAAPAEFAISGEDKKFVWATVKIEADRVIVSSPSVPSPKYVRYAWSDNPVNPNLVNKEGLPASPFRTDH